MNRPDIPVPAGTITIRPRPDALWRFAALVGLILMVPAFLLGDGDVTTDDILIVTLALILSAIPLFGIAMVLTLRLEVTVERVAFRGLTIRDRSIARGDLSRIHAERRATLARGALFKSPQLHVALSGRDPDGTEVDLRFSDMTLDVPSLLHALSPWIAANPALVQDGDTREVLASLGIG